MFTESQPIKKSLYETDYNLWVLETVKQLENKNFNAVDWDNLLEELSDLSYCEKITSYFPAPLLALRALKSELMVGLKSKQTENLQSQDPKWLINGRWGVVQSRAV
jgi:hypothetical protein